MDAATRSRSIILSVLIHAALILILIFTFMKTQIPPFQESGGGGVLVNIGSFDEGSGDVQPMASVVTIDPVNEKVKPVEAPDENFATQDIEEAPVSMPKKDIKHDTKPAKPKITTTPVKKTEPVRKANPGSLYQGPTTTTRSEGTGKGANDQGDPTGDPNSLYHGTGGTGGGPGTGGNTYGDGTPGPNTGHIFVLSGRKLLRSATITDRSQETGKVVVNITVDRNGNVTAATPGGRGSTTTSTHLYKLAQEAAMKLKFDPKPDAPEIQKGTWTAVFVVQ
jgi:periplasmic protein TonB